MSTREDSGPGRAVASRDELVAWIAAGEKPKEKWLIGTEHEKFVFHTDTLTPVPYEGERSISALLKALIARFGWAPIVEGDKIIALEATGLRAMRQHQSRAGRPVRTFRTPRRQPA